MKSKRDPRHLERIEAVKKLFEKSFREKIRVQKNTLAGKILEQGSKLDQQIKKHAPAWPIEQISPADLAVLRLAIYELLYKNKKEPYKVIVDEAVEIAKEYGSESSPSFINGVLGSIIKSKAKK